jgi:hypothetical protein
MNVDKGIDALKGLRLERIYALPLGLLLVFERGCGIIAVSGQMAGIDALIIGVRGEDEPIGDAELEPLDLVRIDGPDGLQDPSFGELRGLAGMTFAGAMRIANRIELSFGGDAVLMLGAGVIAVWRGKGVVQ